MNQSINGLILKADDSIDLQTHTINSDGTWTPEQLIECALAESLALIAITDHDRVDTIEAIQALAIQKQLAVLPAVEMTTTWEGSITDILCYGVGPNADELDRLAQDVLRRQQDNTRMVFDRLLQMGYRFSEHPAELNLILAKPSAQQPHAIMQLLRDSGETSPGQALRETGIDFATGDVAAVVEAAHRAGAVCLIAHPGRSDGFTPFDEERLDRLRAAVPLDGLEVHYPLHSPEQTEMFQAYARKHHLLTSSGSDSHGPNKKPIRYPAAWSRDLLERVGIRVV